MPLRSVAGALPSSRVVGVLLAAGLGTRFGGGKLLAPLPAILDDVPAGTPLAVASARHLVRAIPEVLAVVRPDDDVLSARLEAEGVRVVRCADAHRGMGASLACGVAASAEADGWIVTLADMPWIRPATIVAVAAALASGASIAMPVLAGRRGHPVGFAARHRAALQALATDEGARRVVAAHAHEVTAIAVDDPGVLRDVDTVDDLARGDGA